MHNKKPFNTVVDDNLQSKFRDLCYWNRKTITAMVEESFTDIITKYEKKNGGIYPARNRDNLSGAPMKK